MANAHFGNLADVFKHVALAAVLARLRPAEYWESHAGSASYLEQAPIAAERAHGIHTFWELGERMASVRGLDFYRALDKADGARVIGSALLARRILGESARRYLLCDTDAESLQSIQRELRAGGRSMRELASEALECVQDDGITVLRGAGMLLPEAWHASALAFLDPYDVAAATEAQISPLELACELANRSMPVLVFATFADEAGRGARREGMRAALAKARLASHAAWFEGSMNLAATPAPPTQWGFGMLALNLKSEILQAVHQSLGELEQAYEAARIVTEAGEQSGAWTYQRPGL